MGFWDRFRQALAREASDAREAIDELTDRGHRDMDRREAEAAASPEERIDMLQDEIDASDATFDELRRRAGGSDG